jgi:radical SAM protein with 4Fe4S-binding SPASM domain
MNKRLTDGFNFLSKLNSRRVLNLGKLLSSYYASRLLQKPFHSGMPLYLEIEPTTSCNLRCPQCPSGLRAFTRPTGMLGLDLFKKTLDELEAHLIYLSLYFQGEPFLNKEFLEFVNYAAQKNVYTSTSSNAHYFTDELARKTVESGLDRLIISIDGITQETYSKYRVGGSLDKVKEGTARLLEWKQKLGLKTPHIVWQFIAFSHNEHEIPAFKKLAKASGVDQFVIKTAQVYDYETSEGIIPENVELSRYERTENGYRIRNKLLNHCWRMWRGSVVTWDGSVVPCCFDKDAAHSMGSVAERDFRQVWRSESYNNFRAAVLRSRKEIDICANCTEGTKVFA